MADDRLTQSRAQVQADLNKIEATPEFTSVGNGVAINNKVLGVDANVVALKTDLTAGEIDVTFNGTTTGTTETLTNVVVGDKTYTVEGQTYTAGSNIGITNNAISVDSGSATNGQFLQADGSGGATWKTVDVRTYKAFPSAWSTYTTQTIANFCAAVNADATAVEGMAYLGELRCSDLPAGLANVEAVVEVVDGTGTSGKTIHIVITSGNVTPYRWEYTYWNNGSNVSGWIGFQPKLTAGANIDITENTISAVDTTYTNEPAAQGGTTVSLVTTGEKYTWNNKSDFSGSYTDLTNKPDIPTVNNATLTIKAGGTSKGTFTANSASDVEVDITAADLGLSSALKFIGTAQTTQPSVGKYIKTTIGSTTYYVPVTTTGTATQVSATKGDVIVIGSKEYVCTTAGTYGTNVFQEIGDEGSYALNTVTITGTGVLGGGGTLAGNRTITHNEVLGTAETTAKVFKTKIDKYGHISEATAATASDVGAEAAFVDGSATIASVTSDIVTLKAGVAQSGGAISNNSGADITLAKVAKTGSYTDLTDKPTIETYTEGTGIDITAGVISLDTDVAALKSDLAVGEVDVTFNGTATQTTETLNNVVVGNKTYTISQGTTYTAGDNIDITNNTISVDSGSATSGQLLAADGEGGATWVNAPSTGVTSLGGKTGAVTLGSNLAIDNNNVLSATDTTYESKTAASGGTAVSLVTTGEKYTWNNKQNTLSTQTAYSAKGSATKVPQITTNSLGQVTGITEVPISQPTVNDATLTITQNGTSKGTFTANASSNVTIALTDTTYESKSAASGGTAESLVTTGEKYTWNNKMSNPMTAQGDIIYGAGSGSPTRLAKGTAGQVLTMNSGATAPEWVTPASGMSNPMTTAGDLIVGGSSGTPARLGIGNNGQVLTSNGTSASWQNPTGGVTSFGGTTGAITLGSGLSMVGNQLTLSITSYDGTVIELGYSGNITAQLRAAAGGAGTYIKFGSAPTSANDYDSSVNSTGTITGDTTYSNETKVYVWGNSGVIINGVTTSVDTGVTYDNAVEVILTGDYNIVLLYSSGGGGN